MASNPFSLENKTILITGASSGIGRSCAVECSKAGAIVYAFGRNSKRLNETISVLKNPAMHKAVEVELTDYDSVEECMKQLEKDDVRFNGAIHSAGISVTLPLRAFSPEKIDEYVSVNVTAAINLCKWITRRKMLPESGSSIVFLSSVMGSVGESGKFIYGLTKGAIDAATRSLAVELASKNIRINSIAPGVVETPMSKKSVYSRTEETASRIENLHPLGLGKPEDVAYAAIYLLSEASRWVTGTSLVVDGGYMAR
jgi:NAD(P)-dependent dehydrogenase (short-subunit alcohol dehydrogenase family)